MRRAGTGRRIVGGKAPVAALGNLSYEGTTMTPSAMSEAGSTERRAVVVLLLFAGARQAAGTAREEVRAATVGEVLEDARARYGPAFSAVLDRSRVWLNGEPVSPDHPLADRDEVAVLPPVSGGAADEQSTLR
jgi:molybdopterin synthase sulfur carrier subunit